MKERKTELTFGFSEIMARATPEVIHETFNKMNPKLQMENRPKVGVGVIIIKDTKILLLGKRKNAHGESNCYYPEGHFELGEFWEKCSRREVREEVGIEIKNLLFGTITSEIFENEHKHYIKLV